MARQDLEKEIGQALETLKDCTPRGIGCELSNARYNGKAGRLEVRESGKEDCDWGDDDI